MAIASSLPSAPITPTEQSLMTEIVDYVNKQSNGQLADRIRSSMTSLIGALDKQTSDMLSVKGHPLKWLLEDKKTIDAVKQFNKVLQTSVKLYSTTLQNLNVKIVSWSKDTSDILDSVSNGFAGINQATGQFVTVLQSGREKVQQLVDNITSEFDSTQAKQPARPPAPNMAESELRSIATNILGAIISNGLIFDKKLNELHQDNRFLQHIATNQDSGVIPALDSIRQAIVVSSKNATNGTAKIVSQMMSSDDRLSDWMEMVHEQSELHQDNRFLQHIATNQDSGVIPALDSIRQAIVVSSKNATNGTAKIVSQMMSSDDRLSDWMEMVHEQSVEAQQDAEFNSQNLVVTVAGFNGGAVDQLKRLFNVKAKYDNDNGATTGAPDSKGGGGILSMLGFGATGVGAATSSGLMSSLMALLRPVLKRLPVIGTLINFGLGIQRFVKGDILGGVTQMAAGIAYMFPGIGTAIGIGLDVLLYARDKQGGGAEGLAKGGPDIFKQAWVIIKQKMQQWWDAISTTVSDFLTTTLPSWLEWGGQQLTTAWNWISDPKTIATFSQFIDDAVGSITDFISGPDGLTKKIGQFFEGLKTTIPALGEKLIEYLVDNKSNIYDAFLGPNSVVLKYAGKILGAIGDITASVGKLLLSVVSGALDLATTLLGKVFENSLEGVKQLYSDYIAPIVDPLIQNVTQFPKRIWDWFKETGPGKFLFGLFEGIGKIASGDTEAGIMALDASVMPGIGAVYKSLQKDTTGTIANVLDTGTGTKIFSKTLNAAKATKQSVGNAIDWIKNLWGGPTTATQHINDAIISNGKAFIPNKDDQIWATKTGGPIDKAITKTRDESTNREQQRLQTQLIKQLQKVLQETLAQAISGQGQMLAQIISSMPVSTSSGGGANSDSSLYSGDRDPAYIHRMKAWHSISPPARVAY